MAGQVEASFGDDGLNDGLDVGDGVEGLRARGTRRRDLRRLGRVDPAVLDHLKKGDMAKEAERLLADTGWVPEPLRTLIVDEASELAALPAFLADEETPASEDQPYHAMAAE